MPPAIPLNVPNHIKLINVAPGAFASGIAGGLPHTTVSTFVTARVDGDSAGVFSIAQVETRELELVSDPDVPGRHWEWVSVLTVQGQGPIELDASQALVVSVVFSCPRTPNQKHFPATVVAFTATAPDILNIPLDADVADVPPPSVTITALSRPSITAGQVGSYSFRIRSFFSQELRGIFTCSGTGDPAFTSDTDPQFPFVPPNSSLDVTLPVLCAAGTTAGYHRVVFRFRTLDQQQIFGSTTALIEVLDPPKPRDHSIVWEEATDLSISIDPSLNAWHAGRIKDILLRSDGIFVAASTGGVWGIDGQDPEAGAGCTTDDLDNPNINCMAFGPDSPLQIYAGCSSLKLGTRPGTGLFLRGLSEWNPIPIVDALDNPLLTGDIIRILVLPLHRVIVLATTQGVFISAIPSHTFTQIASLPSGTYSGMCVGPNETVAVSRWGPPGGIFVGTWSGDQLTFAAAQMIPDSFPNGTIDLTQVTRTSLASCGTNPSVMYAVFAGLDNRIYRILRSDSGGASWRPVFNRGVRVAQNLSEPLAPDNATNDMAGSTGWYTNCIAVAFHDSNEVGIGWANGPWLTSNAAEFLSTWTLAYETANSDQVHGDIQFILFDPKDPSGNTIYVASDGGLMFTLDRAGASGYQTRLNKHLRNLQFYAGLSPGEKGTIGVGPGRLEGGAMSASPTVAGLIAGPTQDNGNLFCDLENSNNKAWQFFEGGDGGIMCFLSNGLLLSVSNEDAFFAKLSRWSGSAFVQKTAVPVTSPSANALTVLGDAQAVTTPSFALPDSQKLMFAVAATANAFGQLINVYGLFTNGSIDNAEWQLIATLSLQPSDAITSVASLTGHQVFAGTKQGRIFSFAPFQTPFELVVSPSDKGPVHHITVVRDALAFALYDGPFTKAVLQSEFFNWDPLGSNDNVARGLNLDSTENFIAMTVDRETNPFTLYACTDNNVFVSRDEGDTWLLATTHLPSRSHCTSFAIGAARPSGRHLYLSTYGRSVWQAKI